MVRFSNRQAGSLLGQASGFRKHLHELIETAAGFDNLQYDVKPLQLTIGLAISGGVDSMALAALCDPKFHRAARNEMKLSFRAFIVDHSARQGSDIEAKRVADTVWDKGIPASVLKIEWPAGQEPGKISNFESMARRYRFQALAKACREYGIQHLCLAHHLDDCAETILMRLINGHSGRGLRGPAPVAGIPECFGMYGAYESGRNDLLVPKPAKKSKNSQLGNEVYRADRELSTDWKRKVLRTQIQQGFTAVSGKWAPPGTVVLADDDAVKRAIEWRREAVKSVGANENQQVAEAARIDAAIEKASRTVQPKSTDESLQFFQKFFEGEETVLIVQALPPSIRHIFAGFSRKWKLRYSSYETSLTGLKHPVLLRTPQTLAYSPELFQTILDTLPKRDVSRLIAIIASAGKTLAANLAEVPEGIKRLSNEQTTHRTTPSLQDGVKDGKSCKVSNSPTKHKENVEFEDGGIKIMRPFLKHHKSDLITICEDSRTLWFEDHTNYDQTLTLRNATRHFLTQYKLPFALQNDNILQISRPIKENSKRIEDAAIDQILSGQTTHLDPCSGTLGVRFRLSSNLMQQNTSTIRPEELSFRRKVACIALRTMLECISSGKAPSPRSVFQLSNLMFPACRSESERTKMAKGKCRSVAAGVMITQIDEDHPFAAESDCPVTLVPPFDDNHERHAWLIQRQPPSQSKRRIPKGRLVYRPKSRSGSGTEPDVTAADDWQFFDGRFWCRIQNIGERTLHLRYPMRSEISIVKSWIRGTTHGSPISAEKRAAWSQCAPVLPVIFEVDEHGIERLIVLPSLGLDKPGAEDLVKYEIRFKKPRKCILAAMEKQRAAELGTEHSNSTASVPLSTESTVPRTMDDVLREDGR